MTATENADTLSFPPNVPVPVRTLAQEEYATAISKPFEWSLDFAAAVRRLATDTRMESAWRLLRRRKRDGSYEYPGCKASVDRDGGISRVRELTQDLPACDQLQEQAMTVLFLDAIRFFTWDRRLQHGPRTKTRAEILKSECEPLQELAARLRVDAKRLLDAFGMMREAAALQEIAAVCEQQAQRRIPRSGNPWIVTRRSDRVGDDWTRGFIIAMTNSCQSLFANQLFGTVATIANVALDRVDIDKAAVQGVVRNR